MERQVANELARRITLPLVTSSNGNILSVNESGAELFGLEDIDAVAGRPIADFIQTVPAHYFDEWLTAPQEDMSRLPVQITDTHGKTASAVLLSYPSIQRSQPVVKSFILLERSEDLTTNISYLDIARESIFLLSILDGIPISLDASEFRDRYLKTARIKKANAAARAYFARGSESIEGSLARGLAGGLCGQLIEELALHDFSLYGQIVSVANTVGSLQFTRVNASAIVEGGVVRDIWITFLDLSDSIDIDRRILDALEIQRETIARNLHDNLGQMLTGIRMLSESLVERELERSHPAPTVTNQLVTLASAATEEIRAVSHLLAGGLYRGDLSEALRALSSEINSLPSVSSQFISDETEVENGELGLQLFRIAQEAVNNALRHGRPDNINIRLRQNVDNIELAVFDDGQGIKKKDDQAIHYGIAHMNHRAKQIRASISIESNNENGGTIVFCVVPTRSHKYR